MLHSMDADIASQYAQQTLNLAGRSPRESLLLHPIFQGYYALFCLAGYVYSASVEAKQAVQKQDAAGLPKVPNTMSI